MIFVSFYIKEIIITCSYRAPIVPPNPPTLSLSLSQSNFYLANFMAAAVS